MIQPGDWVRFPHCSTPGLVVEGGKTLVIVEWSPTVRLVVKAEHLVKTHPEFPIKKLETE